MTTDEIISRLRIAIARSYASVPCEVADELSHALGGVEDEVQRLRSAALSALTYCMDAMVEIDAARADIADLQAVVRCAGRLPERYVRFTPDLTDNQRHLAAKALGYDLSVPWRETPEGRAEAARATPHRSATHSDDRRCVICGKAEDDAIHEVDSGS